MTEPDQQDRLHLAFIVDPTGSFYNYVTLGPTKQIVVDNVKTRNESSDEVGPAPSKENSFRSLIYDFRSTLGAYRRAIGLYLSLGPAFSRAKFFGKLDKLIKSRGQHLGNIKDAEYATLPIEEFENIRGDLDELSDLLEFSSLLPGLLLVGLATSYDVYIGKLIEMIVEVRPEILDAAEKQFSLRQLMEFKSFEDARSSAKQHIVDDVMRDNRQKQINWIATKLNLKLDMNDAIWGEFVEICERRNLFAHSGGRINRQYLENCNRAKTNLANASLDDLLEVSPKYLRRAIDVFYEVGVKIGIIVWRALVIEQREAADDFLAEAGYKLIKTRRYKLAQQMLEFGRSMPAVSNERIKKQYIVNLANAYKLAGDSKKSSEILSAIDWTASAVDFQICVAAIKDDISAVTSLMKKIGPNGDIKKRSYLEWPVFANVRKSDEFKSSYKEIFGVSLQRDEILLEAEKTPKAEDAKAEGPKPEINID